MKHKKTAWALALIIGGAFLASPVLATNGHDGYDMDGGMSHGTMQQNSGGMIMLGDELQDGVKAMFHLVPIDAKNLPAGQTATHHLMVMFTNIATGQPVSSGTVAVKVGFPDGKEASPVKLMGMQGHFGVDVNLNQAGIWHFRIATKLTDGKVRQFHTHHVVK